MKPNGKQFAVRSFAVVLLAVGLLSSFGVAETVHGAFKLPVQARWGTMLLAPGDYEFTADSRGGGSLVTVRSMDSQQSGMVMSATTSIVQASGSGLKLGESEGVKYVKTLYLGDLDVQLNFGAPKSKIVKLAKSQSPTMASAAGSH
jgi:hypothetical protein